MKWLLAVLAGLGGSFDSQKHHHMLCYEIKRKKVVGLALEAHFVWDVQIPHASTVIFVLTEHCLLEKYY